MYSWFVLYFVKRKDYFEEILGYNEQDCSCWETCGFKDRSMSLLIVIHLYYLGKVPYFVSENVGYPSALWLITLVYFYYYYYLKVKNKFWAYWKNTFLVKWFCVILRLRKGALVNRVPCAYNSKPVTHQWVLLTLNSCNSNRIIVCGLLRNLMFNTKLIN